MKYTTPFLALTCVVLVSSCASEPQTITPKQPKQLLVLVYDISKSVDRYAVLKTAHLEVIYESIGINGGGRFYGLHIGADSDKQEPVRAVVSAMDTLDTTIQPWRNGY